MHKTPFLMIVVILVVSSCSGQSSESALETALAQALQETQDFGAVQTSVWETQAVRNATSTPIKTDKPKPTQTNIPTKTLRPTEPSREDVQKDIAQSIISDLEKLIDVDRVNLVRFDIGRIEIEVQTAWASEDNQPEVSWTIITFLAGPLAETTPGQRLFLTGDQLITIALTTYSTNGDYRYKSETNFETIQNLKDRTISYEEWVIQANAGFR